MPKPHLIYLAIGFPPAAKSSTYRLRETANAFVERGWDVTVINLSEASWATDYGIDASLLDHVHPDIVRVELPLFRKDQATDIRTFSRKRALNPVAWNKEYLRTSTKAFPEPYFGRWKRPIIEAVEHIHREHPADLVLATCVPYVLQSVAHHLHVRHGVPYAIDYRDGWSIDVVNGVEAFPPNSRRGRLEKTYLDNALSLWVVNDPIAEHFRARYPEHADKIHVVRNGFDRDSRPPEPVEKPADRPLVFGYVGSVNFKPATLSLVLDAWGRARATDPRLANARLEVHGHIGAGAGREATSHTALLLRAADQGVSVHGSVAKRDLAALYDRWDALLLILIGGRYVTSGKVYEYMATGLPILSAHAADHDASAVLAGYPLWTGAFGLDEERLTQAFSEAAELAATSPLSTRLEARRYADRYERSAMMAAAVDRLAAQALAAEQKDVG
jgi:glycosyltransferase involved in cell wall biosynthesis